MSFSNYFEAAVLDHMLRSHATGLYTDLPLLFGYVGLLMDAPTANLEDSFTEVPNTNGYARAVTDFEAPSNGYTANLSDVTFPEAVGDWGEVNWFAVFSAETWGTGHLLIYGGLLEQPTIIIKGSVPRFDAGEMSITLD